MAKTDKGTAIFASLCGVRSPKDKAGRSRRRCLKHIAQLGRKLARRFARDVRMPVERIVAERIHPSDAMYWAAHGRRHARHFPASADRNHWPQTERRMCPAKQRPDLPPQCPFHRRRPHYHQRASHDNAEPMPQAEASSPAQRAALLRTFHQTRHLVFGKIGRGEKPR